MKFGLMSHHSAISERKEAANGLMFDAETVGKSHLSYCTNIHPAETWDETRAMLETRVLAVRDLVNGGEHPSSRPFGIGLRLSALAAEELLVGDRLDAFKTWLEETNTYVFTINGFPYGNFHGTRVKERVFQPDWTDRLRLDYTKNLFRILAVIARPGSGASVSTLPGSHKTFAADERLIRRNLIELADWLEDLALETGHDFHLGLEPEPLGHFENTVETLAFFEGLHADAPDSDVLRRRIGVNYDACHFALQYDEAGASLDAMTHAGIRISKIHLSSALAFDPRDAAAIEVIRDFDEPVYFHQVLLRDGGGVIHRFVDLPDFLTAHDPSQDYLEARVHFHIPLDTEPAPPLRSTRGQARAVLKWCAANPGVCSHYEIETYTWAVLPESLRRPVEDQIAGEFRWVLAATTQFA